MTVQKLLRITAINAVVLFFCMLSFFQTGCGGSQDTYLEIADTIEGTEKNGQTETADTIDYEEETDSSGEAEQYCYVYVCGEVKSPGVYMLKAQSRIYEAVALAGGMTDEADEESVNQAEFVSDGMMIRIPNQEEAVLFGSASYDKSGETSDDGRLDLNTATAAELMTLPGIGEAKAESILQYREESGGFSCVEDIMQVAGIKEGVYNQIKDSVKVLK